MNTHKDKGGEKKEQCDCHCHQGSGFFGTKYTLKPKHFKTEFCEACKRGENCEHCNPPMTTSSKTNKLKEEFERVYNSKDDKESWFPFGGDDYDFDTENAWKWIQSAISQAKEAGRKESPQPISLEGVKELIESLELYNQAMGYCDESGLEKDIKTISQQISTAEVRGYKKGYSEGFAKTLHAINEVDKINGKQKSTK